MQISGSLENIGEHYKMAVLGTNPTEVAFCLFRTVKKKPSSLFHKSVGGETITERLPIPERAEIGTWLCWKRSESLAA